MIVLATYRSLPHFELEMVCIAGSNGPIDCGTGTFLEIVSLPFIGSLSSMYMEMACVKDEVILCRCP